MADVLLSNTANASVNPIAPQPMAQPVAPNITTIPNVSVVSIADAVGSAANSSVTPLDSILGLNPSADNGAVNMVILGSVLFFLWKYFK